MSLRQEWRKLMRLIAPHLPTWKQRSVLGTVNTGKKHSRVLYSDLRIIDEVIKK